MTMEALQFFVAGLILGPVLIYAFELIQTTYLTSKNKTKVDAKIDVVRQTANITIRGPLDGALAQMANLLKAFKYVETTDTPSPEELSFLVTAQAEAEHVYLRIDSIRENDPSPDGRFTTEAHIIRGEFASERIDANQAIGALEDIRERMNGYRIERRRNGQADDN